MTSLETEHLHRTTLRILEEIGVRLEHDEIISRLLKAGARPGTKAQEIRFPSAMVKEYLTLAPPKVELRARNGTTTMLEADSPSVFWTNPCMYLWTGSARREIESADLASVARLCDSLEAVQGVMGVAMEDVPPPHRDFVGLRVIAENCRKHARVLCFTPHGAEALVEMKRCFDGPWFSIGFTAHGPLRWTHLALDFFAKTAGHGIPSTINGEPMAGATGPVSLAGSIAIGNAEIIAGIIVNQVLEPGRPLIYNLGLAHILDMKHATAVTGGPENALFAQASAELGRFYSLPSSSWVSTESLFEDEQAALEKMFGIQTHMAHGVSLIWGLGQLESEKTISLAQLVMDNEMIAYARRYHRGFTVTEDELQCELAREVGITGSFLETEHTLAHHREAFYHPTILNRLPRSNGHSPLHEVARQRAEEMIARDQEAKIGSGALTELRRIEDRFRLT